MSINWRYGIGCVNLSKSSPMGSGQAGAARSSVDASDQTCTSSTLACFATLEEVWPKRDWADGRVRTTQERSSRKERGKKGKKARGQHLQYFRNDIYDAAMRSPCCFVGSSLLYLLPPSQKRRSLLVPKHTALRRRCSAPSRTLARSLASLACAFFLYCVPLSPSSL